jgi:hypothetical protein
MLALHIVASQNTIIIVLAVVNTSDMIKFMARHLRSEKYIDICPSLSELYFWENIVIF